MNNRVIKKDKNNTPCQETLFLMNLPCSLSQTIMIIAELISNANGDVDEKDARLGDDDEREVVKSN